MHLTPFKTLFDYAIRIAECQTPELVFTIISLLFLVDNGSKIDCLTAELK